VKGESTIFVNYHQAVIAADATYC